MGKAYLVKRVLFITEKCKGQDVLNLGCADVTRIKHAINEGQHLHVALSQVAHRLVGVDIDRKALEELKHYLPPGSELICHDVEKLHELTDIGLYDVIICGEL